ncbi:uncharacterized protein EHS24_003153 [Apiotrichum porosum]|uniref:beta-glucosidase n=1 Tax=Apiotrichum porosum TaxID=105984 RepID=A0A427XFR8_9TREE|nr:uncharacterized protein EHS24_003153 [Apiotrichum porosum]RSH77593.1 hypothetical protein EHS24_003153 [Apiotrichum porosum]
MTAYPYQDASLPVDQRVDDLVSRMSLEEKAGLMFHMMIPPIDFDTVDPKFGLPATRKHLDNGLVHFNVMGSFDKAKDFAEWANNLQKTALESRWGIPITLSTDPRHAFVENPQLSLPAGPFSQWPENIGIAALADPKRMEEYSDIVRQEYIAVGLRMALHPQADLATEPRWSRIPGSLGEDSNLATELCAAQVRGLQQSADLGPTSVAGCVKHFPGGGPLKNGLDSHFAWGTEQVYPGDQWEYHLKPFRAAVAEGVRYVMPAYGKPVGTKFPEVAMAYNKPIITGCLREELGFKGVVVADWGVLTQVGDPAVMGDLATAKAWGVEHLSVSERVAMSLDAGVDQFGGHYEPDLVLQAVKEGLVPESRIDESARRILRDKFDLGLFESPFVDATQAEAIVGRKDFVEAGLTAQKDSVTLLKNADHNGKPLLPLAKDAKVYLDGFKKPTEIGFANVVDTPDAADVAIVRLETPWTATGNGFFARSFHHGNLDFDAATLAKVAELAKKVPVVVEIFADRPAILGSLDDDATAVLLSFGVNESALVEVLQGHSPKGKAPFDMPRSMAAVEKGKTDTPFDTENPFYRFGHGLRYPEA